MREADRKRQLEKRIKYTLCIAVGAVVGIIAGICIGVNLSRNTRSMPMPYTEIEYGLVLEPGELAEYIYDNYWNFIRKSYIIVGDDLETCQLYKISSNVPRHNYDLERFTLDDNGYMRYSDDTIGDAEIGIDVRDGFDLHEDAPASFSFFLVSYHTARKNQNSFYFSEKNE